MLTCMKCGCEQEEGQFCGACGGRLELKELIPELYEAKEVLEPALERLASTKEGIPSASVQTKESQD